MKLKKISKLLETPASDMYEVSIADRLERKGFDIWASPAGSAATWPDIGASIEIDGEMYNLHIEAKMNKTDPMGSIRAWKFEDGEFKKTEKTKEDEYTNLVFAIINSNEQAKENAQKILNDINNFFDADIEVLTTGMLRPIFRAKNMNAAQIKKKMTEYKKNHSYQITTPKQKDPHIGALIQRHYLLKYRKRPGNNLILFCVGNEMFRVKAKNMVTGMKLKKLYSALGVNDIPELPETFDGKLECRLGPRSSGKMEMFLTLLASGLNKLKGTILK